MGTCQGGHIRVSILLLGIIIMLLSILQAIIFSFLFEGKVSSSQ